MPIKKTEKASERTRQSPAIKYERYFEGVGRRKSAVARVRFYPATLKAGKSAIIVNSRDLESYFPLKRIQDDLVMPLRVAKTIPKRFSVSAKVTGGGITAQEEAIRLGLARALVKFSPELRKELRDLGLLTRDARVVERKKYGLHKARRATQWKKR
jgi:small subunit ribosomal protein S9